MRVRKEKARRPGTNARVPGEARRAARRPPWPRPARVPRTPEAPLRSLRAPIPAPPPAGAAARPRRRRRSGLGHAEGDADPDARDGFGFDDPETERTFLGLTNEPDVPDDADNAFGDALLALSSSRVRAWDAKEADTEAWRTYTELMAEARERQREKREAAREAAREAREAAEAASVDAFVKHFPRRPSLPETKGTAASGELEHDSSSKSESAESAFSSRNTGTSPSPPKVISTLTRLAAEATARADADWARTDEVRAMLAEDVVSRPSSVCACAAETP